MATRTWVLIGAAVVFVLFMVIYLLFMIFLPEWVGITGKVALEAERSHTEDSPLTEPEFIDRLHERK